MDVLITVATFFFNLVKHKLVFPMVGRIFSFNVFCLEDVFCCINIMVYCAPGKWYFSGRNRFINRSTQSNSTNYVYCEFEEYKVF